MKSQKLKGAFMKRSLGKLVLAFLAATSSTVFAGGGSTGAGGGGDVLVLPNDRVVLADAFIKEKGTVTKLPAKIVEELNRVKFIFEQYAGVGSFIDEEVFNNFVEYRVVDGIDMPCNRVELGAHPGERALGGCSTAMTTYLDVKYLPKLTIRHFAELVVHERLRAKFPNIDDLDLKEITVGLDTALSLLNDQLNGLFESSQMAETSHKNLEQLRWRLFRNFRKNFQANYDAYMIHPNGGGLIASPAKISNSVTVTLSSTVATYTSSGKVTASCKIGDGSIIHAVPLFNCANYSLGKNARLSQVEFEATDLAYNFDGIEKRWHGGVTLEMGDDTVISQSIIRGTNGNQTVIKMSTGSKILNSEIESYLAVLEKNSEITRSKIRSVFLISENATVQGVNWQTGLRKQIADTASDDMLGFSVGNNSHLRGDSTSVVTPQLRARKGTQIAQWGAFGGGIIGFVAGARAENHVVAGISSAAAMGGFAALSGTPIMNAKRMPTQTGSQYFNLKAQAMKVAVLEFAENTAFDLSGRICERSGHIPTVRGSTRIEQLTDLMKLCKKSKL
ncbi:MAG: hypothetical protein EOP09_03880 [Proteobacteria bacterium]|nr:MAG: hypothetical protein EOP09_03880 [Pseudomonadota bacterium]